MKKLIIVVLLLASVAGAQSRSWTLKVPPESAQQAAINPDSLHVGIEFDVLTKRRFKAIPPPPQSGVYSLVVMRDLQAVLTVDADGRRRFAPKWNAWRTYNLLKVNFPAETRHCRKAEPCLKSLTRRGQKWLNRARARGFMKGAMYGSNYVVDVYTERPTGRVSEGVIIKQEQQ